MRIVIATPLYPPQIGGPSYYAKGLEAAFTRAGHTPVVVSYGLAANFPFGISHALYFFKVLPAIFKSDCVLALDTSSVALPAWCAASLLGKKFYIRTGGDFLWEKYVERSKEELPLPVFYEAPRAFSFKEKIVLSLTRFLARRAFVVFSSEFQKEIWVKAYDIDASATAIIENAVEAPLAPIATLTPERKIFLWNVRPIVLKNGDRLKRVFARVKAKHPEIELDTSMVPKDELLEKLARCYAVLLPSISDITPNYIIDALRFKKPFILTKYSGSAKWLSEYGLIVDPLDEADIERALELLISEQGYAEATAKASAFSTVRPYDDLVKEFISLFTAV